jgi:hypothetical protein
VVEAPSLDADRDESSGEPAESATQLHNGGKTERMGAAGRPAPCGQPACNRVEDVYCLLPGSHDIVTGRQCPQLVEDRLPSVAARDDKESVSRLVEQLGESQVKARVRDGAGAHRYAGAGAAGTEQVSAMTKVALGAGDWR